LYEWRKGQIQRIVDAMWPSQYNSNSIGISISAEIHVKAAVGEGLSLRHDRNWLWLYDALEQGGEDILFGKD
jgi:hypothetical protein